MNKLELPHAKLLYMIAELSKKQYINDAEKRILKQKAISDDLQIFQLLDRYEKSKNEDDLANGLISIAKGQSPLGLSPQATDLNKQQKLQKADEQLFEAKPQQQIQAQDIGVDINPVPQATSPVGTSLHLRKYQHSLNLNNQIKKQILQPYKAQQGDQVTI